MKAFLIIFFSLFFFLPGYAQPANTATNAFMIARIAEKFHVEPRTLDDDFSNDFYERILNELDDERIYFNKEDLTRLSIYRFQLDDEIKQKKNDFLRLLIKLYAVRLQQADTILDAISKVSFNFSAVEKLTLAEDSSYPANVTAMRDKIYKKLKLDVLNDLLDYYDNISGENTTRHKQMLDSAQAAFQKKNISARKRSITRMLQSPGGLEQFVANEYCKALASCYDPHTEFFPLTERENFESELGNQRFRFGFSIKDDNTNGGVIINELQPGSPAFKCGLLNKGDKFQTLQWEGKNAINVSDANSVELSQILAQSNHDKLNITVIKPDGTSRTVTLIKEQQDAGDQAKVKSFLLKHDKTFGYVSLPAFYNDWEDDGESDGCANDVAKEIIKLKKENIAGLILDLRYNGGGSIQEAVELAGIFIDAGPVAQIKNRGEEKIFTLKDVSRGTVYDGPLLILVNGYSASASELVAACLQDYNRALIVGSATFGKATGQLVFPLDSIASLSPGSGKKKTEYYLKLTTIKLYRINGTTAQFTGVTPDIILPDFLQANSQREADEPFALLPTTIDANKYYKPYPALEVNTMRSMARSDADTIRYFNQLETYIHQYKLMNEPGDISLNWKDALAKEKNHSPVTGIDTTSYAKTYSVQNNAYDMEKLKAGLSSNHLNEAFMRYLSHDPYIKISYDLLNAMVK